MSPTTTVTSVTLYAVLLLSPAVSGVQQTTDSPKKESRKPWEAPEETRLAGKVSVKLQLDEGRRPIVSGRINGQGPFRLGIDWGANVVLVSEKVVEKAGLTKQGKMDFGPDKKLDIVTVGELTIGEARFRGVGAAVGGFLDDRIDAVIGFNAFADVLVTIDFPGKKLVLNKGKLPEVNGKDVLRRVAFGGLTVERTKSEGDSPKGTKPKVEIRRSDTPPAEGGAELAMPVVEMKLGDEKFSAFLDTRGPGIYLPDKKMDSFKVLSGPVEITGRNALLGNVKMKSVRVAEPLTVGRYKAEKPVVTFWKMELAVLGTPFLRHFAITLDQQNGRIRLARAKDGPIQFPETDWEAVDKEPKVKKGNEYAGKYGKRTITFEDGRLYLRRNDNDKKGGVPDEAVQNAAKRAGNLRLTLKAKDEFEIARVPGAKVRFVRDGSGKIKELHVLVGGKWEVTKRE